MITARPNRLLTNPNRLLRGKPPRSTAPSMVPILATTISLPMALSRLISSLLTLLTLLKLPSNMITRSGLLMRHLLEMQVGLCRDPIRMAVQKLHRPTAVQAFTSRGCQDRHLRPRPMVPHLAMQGSSHMVRPQVW
jgi:hypothetical protein